MYQVEKFKIPTVKLKCKYYVLESMQCNEDSSKRKDCNTKYIYKIFSEVTNQYFKDVREVLRKTEQTTLEYGNN